MSTPTPRKGALSVEEIASLRDELAQEAGLDSLSALFNAAGNDTRIRILYLLWRHSEIRVNDLAEVLEVSTPAVSQQLKKLRRHRLVTSRRDAQAVFYRLSREKPFISRLVELFERVDSPVRPPFQRYPAVSEYLSRSLSAQECTFQDAPRRCAVDLLVGPLAYFPQATVVVVDDDPTQPASKLARDGYLVVIDLEPVLGRELTPSLADVRQRLVDERQPVRCTLARLPRHETEIRPFILCRPIGELPQRGLGRGCRAEGEVDSKGPTICRVIQLLNRRDDVLDHIARVHRLYPVAPLTDRLIRRPRRAYVTTTEPPGRDYQDEQV